MLKHVTNLGAWHMLTSNTSIFMHDNGIKMVAENGSSGRYAHLPVLNARQLHTFVLTKHAETRRWFSASWFVLAEGGERAAMPQAFLRFYLHAGGLGVQVG